MTEGTVLLRRPLASGLAKLEFANERQPIPIKASKYGVFLIVVTFFEVDSAGGWRHFAKPRQHLTFQRAPRKSLGEKIKCL